MASHRRRRVWRRAARTVHPSNFQNFTLCLAPGPIRTNERPEKPTTEKSTNARARALACDRPTLLAAKLCLTAPGGPEKVGSRTSKLLGKKTACKPAPATNLHHSHHTDTPRSLRRSAEERVGVPLEDGALSATHLPTPPSPRSPSSTTPGHPPGPGPGQPPLLAASHRTPPPHPSRSCCCCSSLSWCPRPRFLCCWFRKLSTPTATCIALCSLSISLLLDFETKTTTVHRPACRTRPAPACSRSQGPSTGTWVLGCRPAPSCPPSPVLSCPCSPPSGSFSLAPQNNTLWSRARPVWIFSEALLQQLTRWPRGVKPLQNLPASLRPLLE